MRGSRRNTESRSRFRGYQRRGFYGRNRYNRFGNYNAKNNPENISNAVYVPDQENDDISCSNKLVINNDNSSKLSGWNLYFPCISYSNNNFLGNINKFKEYFRLMNLELQQIQDRQFINLDFQTLINSEFIKINLLDFATTFNGDSLMIIKQMSLALHSVIYDSNSKDDEQISEGKVSYVSVRLINYFPIQYRFNLRADQLGSFIAIQGTVIRISPIKPICIRMKFQCAACSQDQVLVLPEGYRFAVPTKCLNKLCRSKTFEPIKESEDTWTIDYQVIKLQECNQDSITNSNSYQNDNSYYEDSSSSMPGGIPRTLTCVLLRTLVDSCVPGDRIIVCGCVAAESPGASSHGDGYATVSKAGGGGSQCLFDLVIHVNSLMRLKETANSSSASKNTTDNKLLDVSSSSIGTKCTTGGADDDNDTGGNYEFSVKELYAIEAIFGEADLFRLLVSSLCPTIFGHELVKASLLLALFGGVTKYGSGSKSKVVIRGNCHVLIVGDPGLGKSQMLQFACAVAPRSVYVCGSTASSAGLTVTFCKDSSSESSLEAGALLVSDQGCCCIDEFDKMTVQQHASLLEAMEQQSISVAKAGIVCNLSARTSILAAANPCTGHYDKSKTVQENLRLSTPLLSRFDLVFIMLDRPNEVLDSKLSRHVLALHAASSNKQISRTSSQTKLNSPYGASPQINVKQFKSIASTGSIDISGSSNSTIQERLSYGHNQSFDPIPIPLMQKYIAYARKYVHPKLSQEAADILQEFYLSLRKKRNMMDGTPITTRQLESLIRMTEARARAELREIATAQDALDVKELMLESMLGVYSDELGIMNFSRSQSGRGMSKGGLAKKFVSVLQRKAEQNGSSVFKMSELKDLGSLMNISFQDIDQIISNLNQQGFLLKKGSNMYQLLTAGF